MTTATKPSRPEQDHIHTWFGLTYSNYLVLPRTLLQSMPDEWQERFVGVLEKLGAAFSHVEMPQSYKVDAATEHEVGDLDGSTLAALGITRTEHPCTMDHDHDENHGWDCNDRVTFSSYERDEMDRDEMVLVPCADPVPHYNRGRAYIEPFAGQDG